MTLDFNPTALGLPLTTLLTLVGGLGVLAWTLRRAPAFDLTRADAYAIALRTTLLAILGGRVLHVIDFADFYAEVPFQAFYLWNGGLSAWGALIAGAAGALWHARRRGASLAVFADHLVLAGLAVVVVGRLGDLLAGERVGKAMSLPWAITYTNAGSSSFDLGATHPVAAYEMLLVGVMVVALVVAKLQIGVGQIGVRLRPGWAIGLAFAGYAVARFAIGFVTVERTHLGLGLSQWIALVVFAVIAWYAFARRDRILAHADS
jgi:prolipoprotein diacylglyceryltransferase